MQIKALMTDTSQLLEWISSRTEETTGAGENVVEREPCTFLMKM